MTKLSIIIPAYNEEAVILDTLQSVLQADSLGLEKEIIVVDDGSTDQTIAKLKKYNANQMNKIIVLSQKNNHGKGKAVWEGIKKSSGDIVLIQDADREYSPDDYPRLLQPIIGGDADVVYGSRFIGDRPHRVLFFWHMVANKALTLLSNMLTNVNLTDMETGYKVMKSEYAKRLNIEEHRFGVEPEITAKLARMGAKLYEVGIGYRGRSYEEGKKISWRDGVKAIYYIFKYNLKKFPNEF